MKPLIFSILFFSLCLVSTAQNTPQPGLLWNDSFYLLLPVYPADMRSVSLEQADLRAYCPVAGDQAGQHSCVGFALSNTMTILWAQKNKKTNTTDSAWIADNTFSAAFIYNQTKAGKACTSGSFIDVALHLVQTKGDCLQEKFPYDSLDCSKQPNERQLKEAMNFRIDSFQRFPLQASSDSMLHWTLHALSADHPVLAGLKITPNFYGVGKDQDRWQPFPAGGGSVGHALVVVGFDDVEETITLFNSQGGHWGKGGFIKMSYIDYAKQLRYGVVLFPKSW